MTPRYVSSRSPGLSLHCTTLTAPHCTALAAKLYPIFPPEIKRHAWAFPDDSSLNKKETCTGDVTVTPSFFFLIQAIAVDMDIALVFYRFVDLGGDFPNFSI